MLTCDVKYTDSIVKCMQSKRSYKLQGFTEIERQMPYKAVYSRDLVSSQLSNTAIHIEDLQITMTTDNHV